MKRFYMTSAIAVFTGKIKGTVRFDEEGDSEGVKITVDIRGLKKNKKQGFHIHRYGDLSDGCESMCEHFNPYGKTHGGPDSHIRHIGDLGNLHADQNGCAKYSFTDRHIKLRNAKANIIGRGLIIHEDEDDLGKGGNDASLKTGNAGKRLACAVIGYAKKSV
jgi:Cu-Zn family superoxide dismutase